MSFAALQGDTDFRRERIASVMECDWCDGSGIVLVRYTRLRAGGVIGRHAESVEEPYTKCEGRGRIEVHCG
jgi:hypothetical protein